MDHANPGAVARGFLLSAVSGLLLGSCAIHRENAPTPGNNRESGWVSLFDGRTLDGWTPKIRGRPAGDNFLNTFVAADGVMRVSYADYPTFDNRFGHIFYKTPFSAFRLRLDYRFYAPPLEDTPNWARANSGVMFHSESAQSMGVEQAFPVSIEAQLLGPDEGQVRFNGNVCTPGTNIVMNGQLITQHCTNAKVAPPPNGEWVRFELEVSPEGVVTHRQNGVDVLTYSDPQYDPKPDSLGDATKLIAAAGGELKLTGGYIALQSEGPPIEFRNIEIMELK
ncbi:DUF1080 domain-containing protein [bacterium]|nr:DUF1080 domain-containing protein [bacterium]